MGLANVVKGNLGWYNALYIPLFPTYTTSTNSGPRGTLKMLVDGAGQIKMTKDGKVLLSEMQIQNPTAAMIARTAVAQDDQVGDGTTSVVLLVGELLKQADRYISEGVHPTVIGEGFDLAKKEALAVSIAYQISAFPNPNLHSNNLLVPRHLQSSYENGPRNFDQHHQHFSGDEAEYCTRQAARCGCRRCCPGHSSPGNNIRWVICAFCCENEAEHLPDAKFKEPIDLHMVEIMKMQHRTASETQLVRGLVLDHGARHPDMPKRVENAFVLTLNVSLEYEKTCVIHASLSLTI